MHSNLVELKTDSDLDRLEHILSSTSSTNALPLRHQIEYIRRKILVTGRVYVDRWPQVVHVCSLHTSEEFRRDEERFDFDVVTLFEFGRSAGKSNSNGSDDDRRMKCREVNRSEETSNDRPSNPASLDRSIESTETSFDRFFGALVIERNWTERGIYGNYVRTELIETSIQRFLGSYGRIEIYGSYSAYSIIHGDRIDFDQRMNELLESKIPSELSLDVLRSSDVEKLRQLWKYGPDEVLSSFLDWLIRNFPSMCLRNRAAANGGRRDGEEDELVAWAHSYSCGAIANIYVDPKYRGCGLSEFVWLSIAKRLIDFSPRFVPYYNITPGNRASERSAEKAFAKENTVMGDEMSSWFFFYDRKHYPEV